MNSKAAELFLGVATLLLSLPISDPLRAQAANATISGIVKSPSQSLVTHAKVSVKNLATGQSTATQTNLLGFYTIPNLTPGDYEVSIEAEGFETKVARATLAAGAQQAMDLILSPLSKEPGTLSLEDLGISAAQAKGNPQEQALLDKRTHMLQIHQRLGLITTAPMLAAVITSLNAKSGHYNPGGNVTGRELHATLGGVTAGMYLTTAYFAIRAPKVPGTSTHGHIRLHKDLAWIHGPGMVLTPILGALAYSQLSNGQRVHGIASAHSEVAIATFASYVSAMLTVSLK